MLRHNLNVMHIEKNVIDNIIGTILNIKGKTKDNLKSHLDLEEMHLRGNLHLDRINPNKTLLPPACFTMSNKEKHYFLIVLTNVRLPNGHASKVLRLSNLRNVVLRV